MRPAAHRYTLARKSIAGAAGDTPLPSDTVRSTSNVSAGTALAVLRARGALAASNVASTSAFVKKMASPRAITATAPSCANDVRATQTRDTGFVRLKLSKTTRTKARRDTKAELRATVRPKST